MPQNFVILMKIMPSPESCASRCFPFYSHALGPNLHGVSLVDFPHSGLALGFVLHVLGFLMVTYVQIC